MKKILCLFVPMAATMACSAQLIQEDIPNNRVNIGANVPAGVGVALNGFLQATSAISSMSGGAEGGALSVVNSSKSGPGAARSWTIYNMGGGYGNSLQFWAYDDSGCSAAGSLCLARMVILDNGNVGIGTSQPAARLSVNGGIVATKIKVNQSLAWPDYVFASGYKLPSLYELEQYIKTHQHLPDVPSASEVAANGIDLGDNQAVLLKKIEEMTLYMIELNKKIDALEKQVADKK